MTQDKIRVLYNGQGMFSSQNIYQSLKKHRIVSKRIGVDSSTKNMSQFLVQPFLIDKLGTAYIYKHKVYEVVGQKNVIEQALNSDVFKVYEHMLNKGHYILDGHKFGGDMLLYDDNPEEVHAKYLLFLIQEGDDVNRNHLSRLSNICKKIGLMAKMQGEDIIIDEVEEYKSKNRDQRQHKKRKRKLKNQQQ